MESEIEKLNSRLNVSNKSQQFSVGIQEAPGVCHQKAFDLTAMFRSDVATARQGLANHVQKAGTRREGIPRQARPWKVSGDVDLFGGDDRVVLLVARDGFGLNYTQGFPLATMLLPRPEAGVSPL